MKPQKPQIDQHKSTKITCLRLSLVIWFALIWVVSSIPGQSLPKLETFNLDKLAHISVYFVLGLLLFMNYNNGLFSRMRKEELLFAVIMLAALDEAHQVMVPNRMVSVWDLAANLSGLTIAYFVVRKRRTTK